MTPEFTYSRLPDDVKVNYPVFANFIKVYSQWCVEQGFNYLIDAHRSLLNQQSYSKDFEDRIIKNLGIDAKITENSKVKTELLYKLLNEFLETRGTKISYEILFRMMFNEQVDILFPRDKLFRTSGSTYLKTNQIVLKGDIPLEIGVYITGLRSNTQTSIEYFVPYFINGERYYIVECSNIEDSFIVGEPLKITSLDYEYNTVHLPLINIEILTPGKYYKKGDTIIPSSNMFDGYFVVSSIHKGNIDSITIINGGLGYQVNDKIIVQESHFDAYVSQVSNDGVVEAIIIRNKGYNFESIPEYSIKTETGTGLIIELGSTTIGSVKTIDLYPGSLLYDTGNITYTINSETGTGLTVKSKAVSHYSIEKYVGKKGFLCYNALILDSYTKHSHSYDIVSKVPAIKYKNTIDKYSNPTGFVYNKIFKLENKLQINTIGVTGEFIRE